MLGLILLGNIAIAYQGVHDPYIGGGPVEGGEGGGGEPEEGVVLLHVELAG